jgi:hypothetical protein
MGGGPSASSTVNFQAAISAAYLSYAAVMVQWRQLTRQNGALLRADTLGMRRVRMLIDIMAHWLGIPYKF